ncbi:Ku family DNA helicase, putative [Talaromyces stipitatus ATCC 10500]|uniref:ATP-dependent DNA helicase II subunit 2 n=1 Tax=Talaromyces stipitatus (strain ATCC 10500 / CBS 375.48 / QM 6759 / NRRL 1006) TaxID=441959 RepID=B8M6T3_TALSN|nr:Ku family DNA helicase, putative [Talaromyces stipitatus ATCC 10500]EED20154.1 Ku family DNA helicase, putative [Talaromyces stipitatus ATCC 10500]
MAEKEATVYIVDVSKSMKQHNHGRDISDLDWAMRYVWDKITTTVGTGRKTAAVGVVGLKTDGTKVPLDDDEGYENITVMQDLGQVLMPDIRRLREEIKPSHTDEGDAISSLIVAIHMINVYTKKLKYKRKIYLVTDGKGAMSSDGLGDIASKLKSDNIELIVLGVDFDDPDYGFKEEDKDLRKAENEALLRGLVEDCEGVYGTLAQAIQELDTPRVKVVRGIPSFRGDLRLGDPTRYDTALRIQVERYYRTYVAKPPSASSFVPGGDPSQPSASIQTLEAGKDLDANLTNVRFVRTYHVDDPTVAGGKRELEREELAKGYEYGRTAVHISESDENITKLETTAALELIGFIQADHYDRFMNMSNSNVIIAQKTNEKAALALSSLIHALFELDCYAIGRLVVKDGKNPLIVLLAPSIEPDYECLLEVQLPFYEDVRSYKFPPLDKVITISGKEVKEHRNLPNEDLVNAMSKYVDSMELIDKDEEGEVIDTIPMEDNYSPLLHRIEQAVRWRAIHPNEPVPPPSERLTRLSKPPKDAQERAQKYLDRIIHAADVKKVPPKTKGRKRNRDVDKPLSGLDVDELLHREKRAKISPTNAIPEFKQMLASAENVESIKDAASQMQKIIEDHIRNSFGDSNYDRVVEELGVLREELVDYEEPGLYNEFIRPLKEKILKEKLGGDRQELWWLIRRSKVGLIDKSVSDRSEVTEEEAKEFLSSK